jgi:hypothetical protein
METGAAFRGIWYYVYDFRAAIEQAGISLSRKYT